ncbi:MAG: hypothetical protein IAG13_24925 [Deltaproteobacteria bacterium]|nr:hypothetical protein [Nannocystaceae bacterium]
MRSSTIALLLVATAMACDKGTVTPGSSGGYRIVPASYGEHSNVSAAAREKCEFDEELTGQVADAIAGRKDGSGKVLTMVITRVRGAEVAWEGEISVIVEGTLESDGEQLGDFRVQRRGLGGVGGGMAGVCRGLDGIAETMAEDIAGWLGKPGHDSKLGQ